MDNEIIKRIEPIEKELSGIKEELHKQNKEKEPIEVHLKDKAEFIRYSDKVSNCSLLKLIKFNKLVIGDRINIQWNHYFDPTFVIVNIDNDCRYYLMPINNLDILPMHHDDNWEDFGDIDIKNELFRFKCSFDVYVNSKNHNDNRIITLASKEDIFDEDKAFPYFKTLFKEGREMYLKEFGNKSAFWLKSWRSTEFAYASSYGDCGYTYAPIFLGFRPLIILGE